MSALLIIGLAVGVIALVKVAVWWMNRSPVGYQDAKGFHQVTRRITTEEMDRALAQRLNSAEDEAFLEEVRAVLREYEQIDDGAVGAPALPVQRNGRWS